MKMRQVVIPRVSRVHIAIHSSAEFLFTWASWCVAHMEGKSMWQAADVFALVTNANILHDWNQFALPQLPQLLSMASMHLSMLWQKGDMNTS